MANPNQRLNIVNIEVNGTKLEVKETSSFDIGGIARASETGNTKITFSQKPLPAMVDVTIFVHQGLDIAAFNGMDDVTVVITTDTGHVYVMANAWTEESTVVSSKSGTLALKFVANKAEQVEKG